MDPEIRYARTSDGVNIAYWTMGSGPAVIVGALLASFSHIALELQYPPLAAFYERLAGRRTVIRYDLRNFGMSDRGIDRLGIEDFALDTIAIVDKLGVDRCDYIGFGYVPGLAVVQPARVRRLTLSGPNTVRMADSLDESGFGAVLSLAEKDWEVYTESLANYFMRWRGEERRAFARFMRECVSQADMVRMLAAWHSWDFTEHLPNVTCATLVILASPRGQAVDAMQERAAREHAAAMPNARVVRFDGTANILENPAVLDGIERFLDEEPPDELASVSVGPRTQTGSSAMTAILFADIVDSTALTERMGDAAFRASARELDVALRRIIRVSGGTPVEGKLLGDGVLATFPGAAQAIEAALRMADAADTAQLRLHLGLHAGDVIREANNVFGGAVNIASRISGLSAPGEVLVSDIVRGLARTSAGVTFEDRGEHALKGVGEPIRVFAVRPPV